MNWYDYGARFYDAARCQWTTPDPLSEWHFETTPFHYCFNNPINFIDPFGLDTLPVNEDGIPDAGTLPEVTVTANKGGTQNNSNVYDGELIARLAKGDERKFVRGSKISDIRPVVYNPKAGITKFDCSGYVAYRLYSKYPELVKVLNIGPSANIIKYANQFGGIRQSNPKVGDLVLWTGHVEIITTTDGQKFETMGSSGKDMSLQPTPKSFSVSDDPKLSWYSGSFVGFWTPQLPQPVINSTTLKQ
jgi:hypothetical protein